MKNTVKGLVKLSFFSLAFTASPEEDCIGDLVMWMFKDFGLVLTPNFVVVAISDAALCQMPS